MLTTIGLNINNHHIAATNGSREGTNAGRRNRAGCCGTHETTPDRRCQRRQRVRPMVELYGQFRSRRDIAASAGSSAQFFGVRLMTLGDGGERGVRLLEFRTGTGLRFTVMIDRGFDIAECEYRGHRHRLAVADGISSSCLCRT